MIADGAMRGLAVDWITSNLYGVTSDGYVFVCIGSSNLQLKCITLLAGQGQLNGIALDPNSGYFLP